MTFARALLDRRLRLSATALSGFEKLTVRVPTN